MIKVNTSQSIKNLQATEIALAAVAAVAVNAAAVVVVVAKKETVAISVNQQVNLIS